MIERKDILSIPYLKKADFFGSYQGLRFRFHKAQKEAMAEHGEGKESVQALEITAWEGPYCHDATPEERRLRMEAAFSEEGIAQGIAWLNNLWEAEPERWKAAKGKW